MSETEVRESGNTADKKSIEEIFGMAYDQIPRVNLDNAQVISRQFLSHIREPMLTIRPDGIQFNQAAITRLPDTLYILPSVDKEKKVIYVQCSDEDEMDSQKWANLKDDKRQARKITGRELGAKIYRLMGWNKGYYYKAYGSLALREDEDDILVLCFELQFADKNYLTEKAREDLNIRVEDLGDEADRILEEDKRRRLEQENREKAKREGTIPEKKKDTTMHSDRFGDDDFGLRFGEYQRRIRIPRTKEGQISFSDLTILNNQRDENADAE